MPSFSFMKISQRFSRRLLRILKRTYCRFLKIKGSPRQISLGLSLGIFIGMTPFLGFHTIAAVVLAATFRWSKIASVAGVFITNPVTAPFIYPFTYKLGSSMIKFSDQSRWGNLFETDGFINLIKHSPMILADMFFGGVIIGLPLAVIAYYLAFNTINRARKRMDLRRNRRIAKRAAILGERRSGKNSDRSSSVNCRRGKA